MKWTPNEQGILDDHPCMEIRQILTSYNGDTMGELGWSAKVPDHFAEPILKRWNMNNKFMERIWG